MSELPDAAARRRAVEAQGSVLVQAPAGSGKTTLLTQRYLRLLGEVDLPERVLALTFTRRAAEEMRERVIQALGAAAGDARPAGMNADTWTLATAARRRLLDAGVDVTHTPGRLRIETIDAFNAWLAGQLPVTAGAGAPLAISDAPRGLYAEAARRALSNDAADEFGRAVERVLELDDQRWQSLVELLSGLLASRDRWLPLLAGRLQAAGALDRPQLERVRRQLDEDLRLLVSRSLHAAHDAIGAERLPVLSRLLHAAALRLDPAAAGTAIAAAAPLWRGAASALRADVVDLPRWRAAAATLLTAEGKFRRRLDKNQGFPPKCADKDAIADLIAEFERQPAVRVALCTVLRLPEPAYDDAQWGRVREVAQTLVLAAAELEQVFRERGAVDFPAVAMAAVRALGAPEAPTDLALRLDYRLQHVLVDEFQDTSSAQLRLVKLLTAGWQRGDGRSLFCVGDPMQSIYGFRQAEVRAFLELAEEGIGEVRFEVERLRSNFRSRPELVAWINDCFARILPGEDDRERGAIAFRPSVSAAAALSAAGGSAAPGAAVHLRGFTSRGAEAEAIAESVRTTLTGTAAGCPQPRIAVLVRAKSHARDIAASLRARAIPFRAVDIEPLDEVPAARDAVTVIRALLHLGDRDAWLALLRAPWVGLPLADLLCVSRGPPVILEALGDPAVRQGLSADGRVRCERLRGILEAAFDARSKAPLRRWVEQTWLALGGAACAAGAAELAAVSAVFRRLDELAARGLPDPAELGASFDDLFAAAAGAAAVEIMTIHKSKGLEFDRVIVPALDRVVSKRRDDLLLAHEFSRAGRDGLVFAARPGLGAPADALFDFLREQVRDAAALEAERLLYVACTRAKSGLLLTAVIEPPAPPTADDEAAPYRPPTGSLLAVLWPAAGGRFVLETAAPGAAAPGAAAPDAAAPVASPRAGPLRRVPADWSPAWAGAAPSSEVWVSPARETLPLFDWASETARRVGSLVHAELQTLDLERSVADAIRAREPKYRRWLSAHGVPTERLPDAAGRVVAALTAVHADPRARWMLARGYRDDLREHGLSGVWRGTLIRVVFDRSFVDAGVRWVIDYKTSDHAGGDLEEFLDREVERYRPQLQRYADMARRLGPEPVRMGLYFPLLSAWREWGPQEPSPVEPDWAASPPNRR